MAAEIRATGLSQGQATAYLDELGSRGFVGAASTPNGANAKRIDVRIGLDGQTDAASLSRWLDDQGIAHSIVQEGAQPGEEQS